MQVLEYVTVEWHCKTTFSIGSLSADIYLMLLECWTVGWKPHVDKSNIWVPPRTLMGWEPSSAVTKSINVHICEGERGWEKTTVYVFISYKKQIKKRRKTRVDEHEEKMIDN